MTATGTNELWEAAQLLALEIFLEGPIGVPGRQMSLTLLHSSLPLTVPAVSIVTIQ